METGAERRGRSAVDGAWNPVAPIPIDGARLIEVKNVVYDRGQLTELFRSEWFDGSASDRADFAVRHVTLVSLLPGEVSQWHRHREQRDIVFPVAGFIRIGLYDEREDSKTRGAGWTGMFSLTRPRALYIPPGVWHSLRNAGADIAAYVVLNDTEFRYAEPDDWVREAGSPEIPVVV